MLRKRGVFPYSFSSITILWRISTFIQRAANVCALALITVLTVGCIPGDNGKSHTDGVPVSNVAAKSDRLDLGPKLAAGYEVETTATVVQTSLSEASPETVAPVQPVPARLALSHFFDALAALDRGERDRPVTILHLGDQHIAADRLTSELRALFQARFGDAGRGFMAPGLFRVAGAEITRAGDWQVASSAAGSAGPFGLSGVRLSGHKGATMTVSMPRAPFDWAEITFASGPETGPVQVAVDGQGDTISTRTANPTWQRIKINADGTTLSVRAEGDKPVELLSLSLASTQPGLRYVNLGVPGATAETHERWTADYVAGDLAHIAPDLVIVGYGTNEALAETLDRDAYAQALRGLISRVREHAPKTSIVIIGPPDISTMPRYAAREGAEACRPLTEEERANYSALQRARDPRLGRWHPPLHLRSIRQTLQRVASKSEAFFWDWSGAMGGPCSIHNWVHATPPLATADHQNFTTEGARKSARALFQRLMRAYDAQQARTAQSVAN